MLFNSRRFKMSIKHNVALHLVICIILFDIHLVICDEKSLAMDMLKKYNYMGDGHPDLRMMKDDMFTEALRDFQAFACINETGIIDKMTMDKLTSMRCGVPDIIDKGSIMRRRRKRYSLAGSKWTGVIGYRFKRYSRTSSLRPTAIRGEIRRALNLSHEPSRSSQHIDRRTTRILQATILRKSTHPNTNSVTSSIRLFADDCIIYRKIESPADSALLQDDFNTLQCWGKNGYWNFTQKSVTYCESPTNAMSFRRTTLSIVKHCTISLTDRSTSTAQPAKQMPHVHSSKETCEDAQETLGPRATLYLLDPSWSTPELVGTLTPERY
ncbi:hypothetical protein LSH36_102g09070 [Paralvinella palmiformis]|uniref:Peptidoglycan binding-like domain-containing protein n=1 Tax=Paralvinella palmiformis TaxID=53620 RepID=A0AAD9K0D1_9ANNE|nr:hypothetical protein LSH36_102g09070 [Paralvinella palmiformis]